MMKTLFVTLVFVIILLQSCISIRPITDHDYSYGCNFKQFQTYNFVNCENDSSDICIDIKETIQKQMEVRGYHFDPNYADVYVGYALLPNKVVYKAFKQPTMNNWLNKDNINESYKTEKYNFHNGMIIVSIIEAKSNVMIWRGFSNDVSKRKKENFNTNAYYSNAIRNIFDEYPLFASNK